MAEKVIITGVNGFVGEHVARDFKEHGFAVVGTGREDIPSSKVAEFLDDYIKVDLLKDESVSESLSLKAVDAIIHLAGLSSVGQSFERPREYIADNGLMAFNIFEKALADAMPGRIVVVSSGALYSPSQPLPLGESSITSPGSPYAVGKLMTEDVARYFKARGLDTVIARPFNHIGPGQGPGFILPDFYTQLLAAQETGTILVGNIDTKRDYSDVRDIVRAYRELALADSTEHDLYNICSGRSLSGREILSLLQKVMSVDNVTVEIDPTKVRPNDIENIVGDSSRIRDEFGWQPEIPIEQTVRDFIASKQ